MYLIKIQYYYNLDKVLYIICNYFIVSEYFNLCIINTYLESLISILYICFFSNLISYL